MSNLIIVISGSAHSGKTTCIEQLTKVLGPENVVHKTEIIRDKNINIDEIRKDPVKYLDFEIEVIGEKILQEETAKIYDDNKIIFFDRSLIDSYFYYTFYLDKSSFDEENIKKYHEFLSVLTVKTHIHLFNIYDMVFLFEPIREQQRFDNYTQKYLKYTQENEYHFIRNMTIGFAETIIDKKAEIDVANISCRNKITDINVKTQYGFLLDYIKEISNNRGIL